MNQLKYVMDRELGIIIVRVPITKITYHSAAKRRADAKQRYKNDPEGYQKYLEKHPEVNVPNKKRGRPTKNKQVTYCSKCHKALVPIADERENGTTRHSAWTGRKLHKACFKALIDTIDGCDLLLRDDPNNEGIKRIRNNAITIFCV